MQIYTIFDKYKKKLYFCAEVIPLTKGIKKIKNKEIVIQRVQSIYLLIAILAMIGLFATAQDVEIFGNTFLVKVSAVVSAMLSVVTIFSFKNRPKQVLFNYLNILINALLVCLLVFWMLNLSGGISFPEKGIEFVFPLVALVMFVLANYNIRKDEKLVKSVDRLR